MVEGWSGLAADKYPDLYRAVTYLASVCDGTRTLDGQGFNRNDTTFGHKLASLQAWSPKQANAAYWMVRKYRGQLSGAGIDYDAIPKVDVPKNGAPKDATKYRQVVMTEDGRFALRFSYDPDLIVRLKNHFPFRFWDAGAKRWVIGSRDEDVEALTRFIAEEEFTLTDVAAQALEGLQAHREARVEASKAAESDFEVQGLGGTLRPFQRAGVEYVVKVAGGRALIVDEMGLGKTVEALAALQALQAFPALIVVPATLKPNWGREATKWLPGKSIQVLQNGEAVSGDVVVTNYDRLKKQLPALTARRFQAVVLDESHYVKNRKAQRTEAATEIARLAKYRILLTGTPVLNRPIELVTQLDILGRLGEMGGFWPFVKRYCNANQDSGYWDMTGASNLEELNTKLRASCYIRRLKSEVLKELPPKQRSMIPMEVSNRAEYQKAEANLIAWIRANMGSAKAEAALRAQALVEINTLKGLTAKGKINAVIEWVESFLETGQSLVIFGHLHSTIDALAEAFPQAAVLRGDDPVPVRDKAVERFMKDDSCNLFIGSMLAGGLGLTLTKASNVAFVELGWNPAQHNQAEDRVHRIGQQDSVNAYYFVGEKTIDEDILALIEAKRQVVDAATEGQALEEQAFLKELMARLLARQTPNDPAPQDMYAVMGDY